MENKSAFSIGKALSFGLAMYKEKPWLLLSVYLVNFSLGMLGEIVSAYPQLDHSRAIIEGILFVFLVISSFGMMYISLKLYDGKDAHFSDIFEPANKYLSYFIAFVLYLIIVLLGGILLIIPGIYFWVKYQFFGHAMIYKNTGIIASFKESARLTHGEMWHLTKLLCVIVFMNIVGYITLVGQFISAPISYLAIAYVYRRLSAPKQMDVSDNAAKEILDSFERNAIAGAEA